MSDELERLRLENAALREMVEEREEEIYSDDRFADEGRESYSWLPEVEQVICKMTTGHTPVASPKELFENGPGTYTTSRITCSSCGAFIDSIWERVL